MSHPLHHPPEGITQALAQRASALRYETLPEDVRLLARQCLLDWLAVTLAGAGEPLVRILIEEMQEQGGAPQAGVVGHPVRLPTHQAALVNGAASHALDYDDVNLVMAGHPSVALLPGLLALAERRGASGAELLTAFVAGYETACRVGALLGPSHYARGFHATATVGSFGAAAACARLLQLDAPRTALAFGIAGTQAAGLKSMFGTMCKPLHAGRAAYNGLLAANLAARGFDSRADVLEGTQGFAATQSDGARAEAALADPPGGYYLRSNLFKYHAACYLTHAAIECGRGLRAAHGLAPAQIRRVTVRVDAGCDKVCNIPAPANGLQAKFSLRQTVAFALAGVDTARLDSYGEPWLSDPALLVLRDKVVVDLVPDRPHTLAEMDIDLVDGRRLQTSHDAGVPAADFVEQGHRLEAKFLSLVTPTLGTATAQKLLLLVNDLDDLPSVAELMRHSTLTET